MYKPYLFIKTGNQTNKSVESLRLDSRGSVYDAQRTQYLEQVIINLRNDNQQMYEQMEQMRQKQFEKDNEYLQQINDLQNQLAEMENVNQSQSYQVLNMQSRIWLLEHSKDNQITTLSTELFNSIEDTQYNMLDQKNTFLKEYEDQKKKLKQIQTQLQNKIETLNIEIQALNKQIKKLEIQLINQQKQVTLYQNETQLWRTRFIQLNKTYNKNAEKLTIANVELQTAQKEVIILQNKKRSVGSII